MHDFTIYVLLTKIYDDDFSISKRINPFVVNQDLYSPSDRTTTSSTFVIYHLLLVFGNPLLCAVLLPVLRMLLTFKELAKTLLDQFSVFAFNVQTACCPLWLHKESCSQC